MAPAQNKTNKYSCNTFLYFRLRVCTNSANELIVKFEPFYIWQLYIKSFLYYSVQNKMIAINVAADIVTVCVGFMRL
jgi:hypothetical protein